MKREYYWLILIFAVTLAVRLFLAFTIPNFTYESYFHLRQIEHISQTGLPLFHDELSYGGRQIIFLPFFHYFLAFFNLFLPLELVAKIIPNLLFASLTILVYLLGKKITTNKTAPLLSAFVIGFLPAAFTTNALSVEALFLPLACLNILAFLELEKKKNLFLYIFTFLLLTITSSAAILIIIGQGIYLLLNFLENRSTNRAELETILFSLFFFVWAQFLFFKESLLQEGVKFVWENIPPQIVAEYFPTVSIAYAIVLVSIIPFLSGLFVIYRSLFHLKTEKSLYLISLVLASIFLAVLQLLQFKLALLFFGIILAIFFSSFYGDAIEYLQKTKFSHLKKYFLYLVVLLLAVTMIPPALSTAHAQEVPQDAEIKAFQWLEQNTPADAGVLSLLEEGHLVTYYSHRKNMMDDQFLLIDDTEKRFTNLNLLFTTHFQTQALQLSEDYHINYLVLTPSAKEKYHLNDFDYITPECFKKIYKEETKIYLVKCEVSSTTSS